MTVAHRIKAIVDPNGSLELKDVPFAAGEQVEVVILAERHDDQQSPAERYPLRGLPYRFDDPFSPAVPEEDWDALR